MNSYNKTRKRIHVKICWISFYLNYTSLVPYSPIPQLYPYPPLLCPGQNAEVTWLCAQYLESLVSPSRRTTPLAPTSRARKRKRLQEAVARLASGAGVSPATNKRRSSVSDAGLLSVSGSFLDCTNSPATNLSDGELRNVFR